MSDVREMSDSNNQTSPSKENGGDEFPVAAIVCLSVGGYVILVILFFVVRRMLVSKGSCQCDCCCTQSDISCSICGKINESCLSCCGITAMKGCWTAAFTAQNKTNCRGLICCSCGCTDGCSDSCSGLTPNILCDCTCLSDGCCAVEPCCPSCFENDLGPNTCGCLCLEIKLRASQCGSSKRSASAPQREVQNHHYNSHEQPETAAVYHHNNVYQDSGRLGNDTVNLSVDQFQVGGDNILKPSHSPSLSPAKTTSSRYLMPSKKSNNIPIPDILSAHFSNRQLHPNGKNTNVNFQETFEAPPVDSKGSCLPSTTILTSSSSGDSQNMSSKSLLNKSTNTDNSIDTSGRLISRSRKSIQPGQISQRFPNKILVSSESLKSSLEKSTCSVPGVSFFDQSLPNMLTNFDALNCQRPLPSMKKTPKSLT